MTHRCSSHPSYSHERSSGPSLLSIAKSLVPWAVMRGLLGSSGAASSSGHRVRHRRLWWPSGGCYFMVQWLGYALWLSAWLVLVLGQAWVQSRPLCVRPCTATGVACRAPPISTHLGRTDRPICSMVRMCGDQAVRQGGNGSRVGSHGGQGNGLPAAVGLCSAVQRDRVRTRLRRLHG